MFALLGHYNDERVPQLVPSWCPFWCPSWCPSCLRVAQLVPMEFFGKVSYLKGVGMLWDVVAMSEEELWPCYTAVVVEKKPVEAREAIETTCSVLCQPGRRQSSKVTRFYTFDHRRLWCMVQADCQRIRVRMRPGFSANAHT